MARLGHLDTRLVRNGAAGGLLGGLVLFVVMAIYNAATGIGFWSILNACFAAFVFSSAKMMPEPAMGHGMAEPMMAEPIVASHLAVGAVLHLLMSAVSGIAFALVLALLLRAGLRILANPVAYVVAGMLGGALLYVIMMYGVAPALNSEIVDFTPRVPFFVSHLLFGATVGAFVWWRSARSQRA
ncbi:hypothetical protein GCM10027360_87120 [Amycolatopsis echigonensis]